ncbi:AAA family ATPase [Desulfomonile tiedjei]|uniref:Cytidylate kinase n=1 Tax=Desulfomonile tiedjei (strain ATCC 49306 / DSM 6799 / DCB-1) TaxID=706587 RepID=I4C6H8_DESTA|nr:cytidylate kinase-like family protein [Desulfomonile tiedjei]AFM25169.1 cytidylate kinase [Desulfomonile tiedjei DSM 6799]
MAIITISRGSYSKGKEVAEKVALKLGYTCISRDLLVEASEQFNTPEIKLIRALHDAPTILERFSHGREKYLAYFASALLEKAQKDNLVYHGLAGHFYLQNIGHVLNVRILADFEDRVHFEMEREGISRDEAAYILKKDDEERRQWSLKLFGIDTSDPALYDMVLHIRKISVDDAVELIVRTAGMASFRTTVESQSAVDDLTLAARIKAEIVANYPTAKVTAQQGTVIILVELELSSGKRSVETVRWLTEMAQRIPVVKEVYIRGTNGVVFAPE